MFLKATLSEGNKNVTEIKGDELYFFDPAEIKRKLKTLIKKNNQLLPTLKSIET